jgi:hypothetical protein
MSLDGPIRGISSQGIIQRIEATEAFAQSELLTIRYQRRHRLSTQPESAFTAWVTFTPGQSVAFTNTGPDPVIYVLQIKVERLIAGVVDGDPVISEFYITVNPPAPIITIQPQNALVIEGNSAFFSVTATGPSLTYQWYRNGVPIAFATSSTYSTPATSLSEDGDTFYVVVSNPHGEVTSNTVSLGVSAAPVVLDAVVTLDPSSITSDQSFKVVVNVTQTGGPDPNPVEVSGGYVELYGGPNFYEFFSISGWVEVSPGVWESDPITPPVWQTVSYSDYADAYVSGILVEIPLSPLVSPVYASDYFPGFWLSEEI